MENKGGMDKKVNKIKQHEPIDVTFDPAADFHVSAVFEGLTKGGSTRRRTMPLGTTLTSP